MVAGLIPQVIDQISRRHPRMKYYVMQAGSAVAQPGELRERNVDLFVGRLASFITEQDFDVEVLFQDPLLIAADVNSPWARRRKIDPAELVDEPWILTASDTSVYVSVAEAFRARGIAVPKVSIVALSGLLRMFLVSRGPFVTAIPRSLLEFNTVKLSLKILPVDLHIPGYPVAILTLKNRVLNPLAGLFIEHVREIARSIASKEGRTTGRGAPLS